MHFFWHIAIPDYEMPAKWPIMKSIAFFICLKKIANHIFVNIWAIKNINDN